ATTLIATLSLHDALPICIPSWRSIAGAEDPGERRRYLQRSIAGRGWALPRRRDRAGADARGQVFMEAGATGPLRRAAHRMPEANGSKPWQLIAMPAASLMLELE